MVGGQRLVGERPPSIPWSHIDTESPGTRHDTFSLFSWLAVVRTRQKEITILTDHKPSMTSQQEAEGILAERQLKQIIA